MGGAGQTVREPFKAVVKEGHRPRQPRPMPPCPKRRPPGALSLAHMEDLVDLTSLDHPFGWSCPLWALLYVTFHHLSAGARASIRLVPIRFPMGTFLGAGGRR